ncbi:LOW QUALITY PROTEIN: protein FAM74A4/A6-like [Rhinopithecus roxellana]|uniref:LOW QUALITY PROTEIN: protein FAM74A4/A6-like n=1 Tax=Rhinopithecus roxellana TaxID=61622 RepID=UPI001237733C|nr:LOW QUALITY PROTEIN: protein FAM74A4/A6-like [Rhinopithecus roxellana]
MGDQIPRERRPGGDLERVQKLSQRRFGENSETVPEERWRAQRLSRRRRGESSEAAPEKPWRELRGCPGGDVERAQRLSRRRCGESSEAVPEETWREFRGCRYCCTWLFFFG